MSIHIARTDNSQEIKINGKDIMVSVAGIQAEIKRRTIYVFNYRRLWMKTQRSRYKMKLHNLLRQVAKLKVIKQELILISTLKELSNG